MLDWVKVGKDAVSLFAIIDPIGSVAIFLSLTAQMTELQKKQTATITAITMGIVLIVSLLIGEKFLQLFGISIPAFKVGGGILIFLLAIAMLNAQIPGIKRTKEEQQEAEEAEDVRTIGVVPMAIPLLAGPGAISNVIINSYKITSMTGYLVYILTIILIALFTWLTYRWGVSISSHLGRTGINIVTRLMGLLLAAISVEIIANGLKGLFPILA
ncbi:MAG: NAAT family transporter [Nitrospinota bacterium]|nr:NAAT family transporter [Nitrospinota bacterium]